VSSFQITSKKDNMISMTMDGRKVTLSFTEHYNPNLGKLVRNTLLDACLRQGGIKVCGK
jgi:hypothetical protein